jgi:hypothetical protein
MMPSLWNLSVCSLGRKPHFRSVHAQQPGTPVIGFLNSGKSAVTIEYRWTGDQYDRLPAMATGLVRQQVALGTGHQPVTLQ